jgi:hypothetical protein
VKLAMNKDSFAQKEEKMETTTINRVTEYLAILGLEEVVLAILGLEEVVLAKGNGLLVGSDNLGVKILAKKKLTIVKIYHI